MALRKAPAGGTGQFDIILSSESQEGTVGSSIVHHLGIKGFCVVSPGIEESVLQRAMEDAKELKFYAVNPAIADGLLGQEGSARIADMESTLDDEARSEGVNLKHVDSLFTRIGYLIEPHLGLIGFDMSHRSSAVVHEAADAADDPPPLTEVEVTKWQNQFLRHKVMVIIFLGPKPGVLELQPFDDEALAYQVKTVPGMMVLLRTDMLSHKFGAAGSSFAVSSFLLTAEIKHYQDLQLTPAAKSIEKWMLERLEQLKLQEDTTDGLVPEAAVPSPWMSAVNHAYHKGQMTGIGSVTCYMPATRDPDNFFAASTFGPDYMTDVPIQRWDMNFFYDSHPEGWRMGKSFNKHGAFMEGSDLFDNRLFNLSPNETRQLDPHQRLLMEVGYAAFVGMGYNKKKLMNAPAGVYVGAGCDDWAFVNAPHSFGGTSGTACMWSGRLSFCLGCKGPSIAMMTEGSSGLSALHVGAESLQKKGKAVGNDYAAAIAPGLQLSGFTRATQCMQGWLGKLGRCSSFAATADGYTRADAVVAVGMKPATNIVDDQVVENDKDYFLSQIAGTMMNTNGKSASLSSPNGPGEQECLSFGIRNALISPSDVDAVECHADGRYLADAVEASSMWRAHRSEANRLPLTLCANKSSLGYCIEPSGLVSMMQSIFAARCAHLVPNQHLRQMNPHIDVFEQPMDIITESLGYAFPSTFQGVKTRGFGGSNVYVVTWTMVNPDTLEPSRPAWEHNEIGFWPGGGGSLENEMRPDSSCHIIGSWTKWSKSESMKADGNGGYVFNVTLGENRWESFQIWLDGKQTRVLHPGAPNASRGSEVLGPDAHMEFDTETLRSGNAPTWTIDGRVEKMSKYEASLSGPGYNMLETDDSEQCMVGTVDAGRPGDIYEVRLKIAGKWRMVDWVKVTATTPMLGDKVAPLASTADYYVSGSWNRFLPEEMVADMSRPGSFSLEVQLKQSEAFQILRNRDWGQVIYPAVTTVESSEFIAGPDSLGSGLFMWIIEGEPGEVFKIRFERMFESETDNMTVSWSRVGMRPLSEQERFRATRPCYSILGSWNNWSRALDMDDQSAHFAFEIELGKLGQESFQILCDGLPGRTLFPNCRDASPYEYHKIIGPTAPAENFCWTVGKHDTDSGAAGDIYEIRLAVNYDGSPRQVEWRKLDQPSSKRSKFFFKSAQ